MEEKYRFLSIEGCEKIGSGARADVYAVNEDQVVKVYHDDFTLDMIESRYVLAKKFEEYDIPIAKAYEIVKTENGYGILMDYIKGCGLGQYMHEHPEEMETLVKEFAALLRRIHQTNVTNRNDIPNLKETRKKTIQSLTKYFSKYDIKVMTAIIDAIPDTNNLIHGDWHAQNVMINEKKELVLIDVDDSGYGNPIFDNGGFQLYIYTVDDHPENAMFIHGMDPEEVKKMWEIFLPAYYQTTDKAYLEKMQKTCSYFGQLHLAQMPLMNVGLKPFEITALVWVVRFNLIFKKSKVIKAFSELKNH